MECPKVVIFDLDDTLAESFMPPKQEMIEHLRDLLDSIPLAIMTGRDFSRIEPGFLPKLTNALHIERFFLFPESSAQCFQWEDNSWKEIYALSISDDERAQVHEAVEAAVAETGVLEGLPEFGEHYVQKRAQTAFACLGMNVPSDLKYDWDPDNKLRRTLQHAVAHKLPGFDVLLGGATTIDVTKKGVNKSYGVHWLSDRLQIPPTEMLYVGDALYEGGNDAVVIPTGVKTIAVNGPDDTTKVIEELIRSCSANS